MIYLAHAGHEHTSDINPLFIIIPVTVVVVLVVLFVVNIVKADIEDGKERK